jgi:hypothetical protein
MTRLTATRTFIWIPELDLIERHRRGTDLTPKCAIIA